MSCGLFVARLSAARIHDQLNAIKDSVELYKEVLRYDSSNVEAIACLASNFFYCDQPELALRFYRRLLQVTLLSRPTTAWALVSWHWILS